MENHGQFTKFYPKFHLTREFLTNTIIIIIWFSLLCLDFSLLVWISHFLCAHVWISHFTFEFLTFRAGVFEFLTFMFEFLTFGQILTFPAGHTPTPAGPFRVAGRPWTTPALPMTWLISCNWQGWRAPAGHRLTCRREKSEKFSEKWEIRAIAHDYWEIQT